MNMQDKSRFATDVVATFLLELQAVFTRMDPGLDREVLLGFRTKLENFLSAEIRNFNQCYYEVVENRKLPAQHALVSRLRHFIKKVVPYDLRNQLHRNPVILELYRIALSPRESATIQWVKNNARKIGMFLPFLIPVVVLIKKITGADKHKPFLERLPTMQPDLIQALAQRIVETAPEGFLKAEEDAAAFEALPGEKKCIFVSHLFATTWAPTVRALNEAGWTTAWLGNNDVQEFGSYGVMTTREIPAHKKFAETFLGTVLFMARMKKARIFLSGECYYGANWNGEDAWVLFSIVGSVAKTIRRLRVPEAKNLYLFMYDGLKPVAKSSQLKQEISKCYGEMMRCADRVIYNSNTETFGEYIENAYGVQAPRLHFYRYSESPKNPMPRIQLGATGDEYHMACITVCLAEFGEPSRDAVPNFVRNIIEQGIHFHYYCRVGDPVVEAFHKSIDPAYRKFFHAHAVNKDQQALVDELHQYHVAFNPSDHIPFSRGISQLQDREYQDGMSVFWQSTVGTSFLVYAAAGLPFVLPRGCTGSTEFLVDTAIPATLGEFKNMKNYLKKINLPSLCKDVEGGSPAGWVDTHIERLINFIE